MPSKASSRPNQGQQRDTKQGFDVAVQDQLFSSLDARLRSPDRSAVLDPAARDEASQLWEVATVSAKDALYVDVDVLTLLAYLHWTRFQYLPDGQDHDDLRDALKFFGMLRDGAPERVPD